MPSTETIILAIGIHVIAYALLFLFFLPFVTRNREAGQNVAPQLWKLALLALPIAAILTFALIFFLL